MKVGITLDFQSPGPFDDDFAAVYRDSLRLVTAADELGYDSTWVTEHHFMKSGYCPAPLVAAAAMATVTRRVTVGTKLLILPLHDPLRVAEDAAVVDAISGGRFVLGIGGGYLAHEYEGFGESKSERGSRLEEGLGVIMRAWRGEDNRFEGSFYSYGPGKIAPRPIQDPHPPIYIGASRGPAIQRAARLGLPLAVASDGSGYWEYRAALEDHGRDPEGHDIVHSLSAIFVDEDGDRAREVAGRGAQWIAARPVGSSPVERTAEERDRHPARCSPASFVGSPEEVVDELRAVDAATPISHLTFHPYIPGVPVNELESSLALFESHVVPALYS